MCVLRVSSNTDPFEAFLRETKLPVYRSHVKGAVNRHRKGETHATHGFCCDVSGKEWSDFPGQVEDAISFLKSHSAELRSLSAAYQIDDMRLDFPVESRLSDAVCAQFDYLPPELIRLCAEYSIGVEISHYPQGEKDDEPVSAAE